MGTSVFNEMIDDQSLPDSQYDVVAGHWPTSANEAVMVAIEPWHGGRLHAQASVRWISMSSTTW